MQTINDISTARSDCGEEWQVFYEWFAGWRWEHHRHGQLVSECFASFETEEECRTDLLRRHASNRPMAARAAPGHQDDTARLAA